MPIVTDGDLVDTTMTYLKLADGIFSLVCGDSATGQMTQFQGADPDVGVARFAAHIGDVVDGAAGTTQDRAGTTGAGRHRDDPNRYCHVTPVMQRTSADTLDTALTKVS